MERTRNYETMDIRKYRARRAAQKKRRQRADFISFMLLIVAVVALCILIGRSVFGATFIDNGPETAININEKYQDVNYIQVPETIVIQDEAQKNAIVAEPFVIDGNISYGDAPVITTEAVKSYSDEDLKYLTMVLTGECQTSSYDNQILYGSVVLNRVKSSEYPNTVKGVCLDTKYGTQYSSFKDGNAYREPTETSKAVALYLLENGSQLPENVIYQAEFRQGSGVYLYTDGTYFCFK